MKCLKGHVTYGLGSGTTAAAASQTDLVTLLGQEKHLIAQQFGSNNEKLFTYLLLKQMQLVQSKQVYLMRLRW